MERKRGTKKGWDWALLCFSLGCIYFLAPDLNRAHGVAVSSAFALLLILNSGVTARPGFMYRSAAFFSIDVLTYYMLFDDQPWDLLFHGGLFETSAAPLIICSVIMSLAGWILLESWRQRWIYLGITCGLQIPIAIFAGTPAVEKALQIISDLMGYHHDYSGAWQAWQLEWMLTYYLPVYFFNNGRNSVKGPA